jgi:glutamate dehydrogenase (NAD(P)+)
VDRVHAELEEILMTAYRNVLKTAQQHQTDLRTASYVVAIDRVAAATRVRWMS